MRRRGAVGRRNELSSHRHSLSGRRKSDKRADLVQLVGRVVALDAVATSRATGYDRCNSAS